MARPRGYRYGPWHGGPDPLAPPYDVAEAMDRIGDDVLSGSTPAEALQRFLRRGAEGLRGLDELRRRLRRRREQLRRSGRLDGTLERVRELLDRALEAERRALFADPDDLARLEEAELDALPEETATGGGARPRPPRPTARSRSCSAARCWTASSRA